jgi:hypothetical protein
MPELLEAFGKCSHYEQAPPEQRYVCMHPENDYTGDCKRVYLLCYLCRLSIIAAMTEQFNKFQAGDECEVLECHYGHRFPSFCQYTVARSELDDIPINEPNEEQTKEN